MHTVRIIFFYTLALSLLSPMVFAQTPAHFQFTSQTGSNATVGIPLTANPNVSGTALASGDEIGAFSSSGLCVGAVVWSTLSNAALTVWGDDPQTPALDGMTDGDTIRYRVWRKSTNTEYGAVTVTYNAGTGIYAANAIYSLSSLTATAPPDAPILSSPASGATNQLLAVTLAWNPAARATSYRVQAATDTAFTSLVLDDSTVTATSRSLSGLTNNRTYSWRVRGSNSGGAGAWSSVWNFTTKLSAPVLTSPSNGSANQPTTLPLTWNPVSGATRYRLQVATDSAFTSLFLNDSTITTTSRSVASLLNNTTYYWRVNAVNTGSTSDWSSLWRFTTTLAAPLLSSPANNSTDQATTLTLSWSGVAGATNYRVQVATDSAFTSPFLNDSTVTATSRSVASLSNSTKYYWRVNAKNGAGAGAWSAIWNLTTVPVPPSVPVLASPAASAVLQPTSITLNWNTVSGATSYRVQLSTISSFSTLVLDDSTVTTTSRAVSSLANATTFYWRVSAKNSGGTGGWSSTRRFTTIGSVVTHGVILTRGWNMVSSFVAPQTTNLDTMTTDIRANLVLMKNGQGQVYWPAIPANTIGNWNFADGYQVYMSNPDTLMIAGNEVIPNMNSLSLAPGWHLISYFRNDSLAVDSALSTVASNLIIVKNNAGKVYWPALGVNDIGKMKDGQGYQLYLSAASTLTYPANSRTSPGTVLTSRAYASAQSHAVPLHFTFTSGTGNNATVGIPSSATLSAGGTVLQSGDEIGIFNASGRCVGATVWNGSNSAITVWGDDSQTSDKDGMLPGEKLYFRVWQQARNQEISDIPVHYSEGDGFYALNGLSILSALGSSSADGIGQGPGMPADFAISQNYPNPFNPSTVIRYDLPVDAHVRLQVFDVLGRVVTLILDRDVAAGYHSVEFDAGSLPTGVYFYKLTAGTFTQIRRMVLVK